MLGEYLEVYKRAELRMYEFSLLVLIYEQNHEYLNEIHNNNFIDFNTGIKYLETQGFVKQHGEQPSDITLRKSGEDLFNKYYGKKKKKAITRGVFVHTWIDIWREIFPPGSNTGGYRYRGNRLEALKKMTKFVDLYDFTNEEIFQATKNYVDKFALKGYMYMQQAHYFIEKKDSGSTLASECEGVRERDVEQVNVEPKHGERII